jgi:hypothetical protein
MVASITDSVAGAVEFGATVLNHQGAPMTSYDLKTFYTAEVNGGVALPALVATEELDEQAGWKSFTFGGGAPDLEFVIEHYMLCFAVADKAGYALLGPDITTMTDNYFAALKAKPFLRDDTNPATHYAPFVQYRKSKIVLREAEYHGVVFKLTLRLNL